MGLHDRLKTSNGSGATATAEALLTGAPVQEASAGLPAAARIRTRS